MSEHDDDKPSYHPSHFGTYVPSANAQRRHERVKRRAEAVFGNDFDGSMWLSRRGDVPAYASRWIMHWEIASESEEGCQAVLARLDELDPVTEKKPLPESIDAARSGRKARRRKSDFKRP